MVAEVGKNYWNGVWGLWIEYFFPIMTSIQRRQWQPTPVFLPGESQGRGSLVGCYGVAQSRTWLKWLNLTLKWRETHSVVSDPLWPHGQKPARFLCLWDSPGKITGGCCHFLLQGIFPTLGLNPGLLHCRQILYSLNHQGFEDPNPNLNPGPGAFLWAPSSLVPLQSCSSGHRHPLVIPLLLLFPQLYMKFDWISSRPSTKLWRFWNNTMQTGWLKNPHLQCDQGGHFSFMYSSESNLNPTSFWDGFLDCPSLHHMCFLWTHDILTLQDNIPVLGHLSLTVSSLEEGTNLNTIYILQRLMGS